MIVERLKLWSQEDDDKLIQLAARGASLRYAAESLHRRMPTVEIRAKALGLTFGDRDARGWLDQHHERLVAMVGEGLSSEEMGRRVGHSGSAVRRYIRRHGLRPDGHVRRIDPDELGQAARRWGNTSSAATRDQILEELVARWRRPADRIAKMLDDCLTDFDDREAERVEAEESARSEQLAYDPYREWLKASLRLRLQRERQARQGVA